MRFRALFLSALSLFSPALAFAVNNTALNQFVLNVTNFIIQPIIYFLFALAMFFFVNGIIVYILKAAEPKERSKGAQHMLWGVVGLFVMASAVMILHLLANSFSANGVTVPNGF